MATGLGNGKNPLFNYYVVMAYKAYAKFSFKRIAIDYVIYSNQTGGILNHYIVIT